jgi:hypothetical protein
LALHRRPVSAWDALERRDVPTTVGPPPFTSLVGHITHPGHMDRIIFQLEPGQFVADRNMPMLLAFDAEPAPGSSVLPKVVRVVPLTGQHTFPVKTRNGPYITNIAVPRVTPTAYEVDVKALGHTQGTFILDAILPGDATGDGVVDRVDIGRIRRAYGTSAGDPNYDPAVDIDRDGKVGLFDFIATKHNLGARSSVVVFEPIPVVGPKIVV